MEPEHSQEQHKTPLCPAVQGETHDAICRGEVLYAYYEKRELLLDLTVGEIKIERTGLGYRFAPADFDTMGYWQHGWWQTTIPYWVGLFGVTLRSRSIPSRSLGR